MALGVVRDICDIVIGLDRTQRRLFRINDKIQTLDEAVTLVAAELEYHKAIDDDAQRDAAVGNYIDREEAQLTAADVRRFEKSLERMAKKRARLIVERQRLLDKLG